MGILELIAVLVTIAGLFIWNRTESRADARHMENLIKSNRDLIDTIHKEWMEEAKNYHARLCEIEAKRGR